MAQIYRKKRIIFKYLLKKNLQLEGEKQAISAYSACHAKGMCSMSEKRKDLKSLIYM